MEYLKEAQIAAEVNKKLGKPDESICIADIKTAIENVKLGPRHEAEVYIHCVEWIKFLLFQIDLLNQDREILRHVMTAAASMAGKNWLLCQLALGQILDGKPGKELIWLLDQYDELKKANINTSGE
jgi:hypothetical protein